MEADSQHGYKSDPILLIWTFVTDKGIDEAIKQMQADVPGEQVDGRMRIHWKSLRDNMQEWHWNQYAGSKTDEIDRILAAPALETMDDIDADGGYDCGQRAGPQGCPESVFHGVLYQILHGAADIN